MDAALDRIDPLQFPVNILYSMTHKHANHSIKLWVTLLVELGDTATLDVILRVVNDNAVLLVMDAMGVRTIIEILKKIGGGAQDTRYKDLACV